MTSTVDFTDRVLALRTALLAAGWVCVSPCAGELGDIEHWEDPDETGVFRRMVLFTPYVDNPAHLTLLDVAESNVAGGALGEAYWRARIAREQANAPAAG